MANELKITIDGKECTCTPGEYLCDIAKRNGIFIPTLCRSDAFGDHRACCRICVVEVEERGWTKIVTGCVYPVKSEIIVRTNTDRIKEERAVVMALLNKRAPESDTIANMAKAMKGSDDDGFGRLVSLDAGKCILCGLCVQACDSVGAGAISTVNRGTEKEVNTPYGKQSSACIGCLSCANVCPTGAIKFSEIKESREIWKRKFDIVKCEHCGAPLGTKEQVNFANKNSEFDAKLLCDVCKRKEIANAMKQPYVS